MRVKQIKDHDKPMYLQNVGFKLYVKMYDHNLNL